MDQAIKQALSKAIELLDLKVNQVALERPAEPSHGDYSSNVALVLYPQLQKRGRGGDYKSPRDLAQAIVEKFEIQNSKFEILDAVEVAGPGFINFTLTPQYLFENLKNVLTVKDLYGHSPVLKGQKVAVEYTDPNPFKEFHIGHLYSNAVGESLSRLYEALGASVWRADYFGDIGIHVAKAVWALLKMQQTQSVNLLALNQQSINQRQKILGQAYALGAKEFKANPQIKAEIEALNTNLYVVAQKMHQKNHGWEPIIDYAKFTKPIPYNLNHVAQIYETGRSWSLEYFETIYKRVGTKFDGYYPESLVAEIGYSLVKEGLNQGIFKESKGAIVFEGEKYALHTRVFINSLGLPTYEAKELGLAPKKYQDFNYNKSVIVTGNEVNEYFKVLLQALKSINPTLGSVTYHIGHGMVRLPHGKMSSRTGTVITGDTLLDQAKDEALKIINQNNPDLKHKEDIADQIGIAAIKYAFLKSNIGSDIVFNLNDAISFNGNSGPYLQYTHARACSVLAKTDNLNTDLPFPIKLNPQEIAILRSFQRFPEVVNSTAINHAPHQLCTYLYDLAGAFNTFYSSHSILGSRTHPIDPVIRQLRLAITAATAQVLKNGLYLLGIPAPEKM